MVIYILQWKSDSLSSSLSFYWWFSVSLTVYTSIWDSAGCNYVIFNTVSTISNTRYIITRLWKQTSATQLTASSLTAMKSCTIFSLSHCNKGLCLDLAWILHSCCLSCIQNEINDSMMRFIIRIFMRGKWLCVPLGSFAHGKVQCRQPDKQHLSCDYSDLNMQINLFFHN